VRLYQKHCFEISSTYKIARHEQTSQDRGLDFHRHIRRSGNGDSLRAEPIVTCGATSDLDDLRHLQNVDVAAIQAGVLDYFRRPSKNFQPQIPSQLDGSFKQEADAGETEDIGGRNNS
jgi:hypothetical protein